MYTRQGNDLLVLPHYNKQWIIFTGTNTGVAGMVAPAADPAFATVMITAIIRAVLGGGSGGVVVIIVIAPTWGAGAPEWWWKTRLVVRCCCDPMLFYVCMYLLYINMYELSDMDGGTGIFENNDRI